MKTSPVIKFNCNNPNLWNFRYIEIDGDAIHYIADIGKFFEALGYSADLQSRGILPDEFLWDKYTKSGSEKSSYCLQAKLIEYLKIHSAKFVAVYGNKIEVWLEICRAQNRIRNDCGEDCSLTKSDSK